VVGTARAVNAEAAEVGAPKFGGKVLGFYYKAWGDAVGVVAGKHWDVAVDDRSGEI
jgi:dTDP-4-dehydrorhamnose 3,5-epimerase-like enzyme